jgi:hypothetical protein
MRRQPVREYELAPAATPEAPWRVASVEPMAGYRLRVRFHDEMEGVVDMAGLIASPRAGLFAALADADRFNRAFVHYGAVTWPDDLDIAPHAIHRAITASAERLCVLA